jgi:hypothetical protein
MEMLGIIISAVGIIVAVGIACWTIKSSQKDTAKKLAALEKSTHDQIAALEKSTKEQVESIKEMSRLQIDATIQQVDVELAKNVYLAQQAQEEQQAIHEINNSPFSQYSDYKEKAISKFQDEKPQRDFQRYSEYINKLNEIKKGLLIFKNKLN